MDSTVLKANRCLNCNWNNFIKKIINGFRFYFSISRMFSSNSAIATYFPFALEFNHNIQQYVFFIKFYLDFKLFSLFFILVFSSYIYNWWLLMAGFPAPFYGMFYANGKPNERHTIGNCSNATVVVNVRACIVFFDFVMPTTNVCVCVLNAGVHFHLDGCRWRYCRHFVDAFYSCFIKCISNEEALLRYIIDLIFLFAFMVALIFHSHQTEATYRLDFIWKLQATGK